MEFEEFCFYVMNKQKEEELKGEWLSLYPFMCMKMLKFMSFKDYSEQRQGKNIDLRPTEEIIKEIEELHRKGGT